MRTTVDINDELLARAKRVAIEKKMRLSDVVNEALQQALNRIEHPEEQDVPFRFSPFGKEGLLPGIDLDDSGSVDEALDGTAGRPDSNRADIDSLH